MLKSSKLILTNTSASYAASLFALSLSLFSIRWTLEALGESDYGLFGVVGSLIVLITIFNGGLQVGVSRFYAYALGQGENEDKKKGDERLKRWFNTALSIHLVLAIILFLVGWPIGGYAIENWLTIPEGRLSTCLLVFRFSLLTAFMSVFSVPFIAMYTAHQRMVELSVFVMLRTCAVFLISFYILNVSSDRLLVYAYAMTAINVVVPLLQIIRAVTHFSACRLCLEYMFNRTYFNRLFGFVGWKMYGMGCVTLRAQGTPMLINLQFGPLVNTAYQVAFGLSTQATTLSQSLTNAFRPAVISAEGKGDRNEMLAMALQTCKFSALLIIVFAIPLILEIENLLHLWLGSPPQYAALISQWLLAMLIVDRLTTGHMLAVNARGKIAIYELIQGATFLLALPLMWILFQLNQGPLAIGIALFCSSFIYCTGRVVFARYLLNFPIMPWLHQVALPISAITMVVALFGSVSTNNISPGLIRIIVTSTVCLVVAVLLAWFVILNLTERKIVNNSMRKMLVKFSYLRKFLVNL